MPWNLSIAHCQLLFKILHELITGEIVFAIFRSVIGVNMAHSLIVAVVIEGHAVAFDVVFFSSGHISFYNFTKLIYKFTKLFMPRLSKKIVCESKTVKCLQ